MPPKSSTIASQAQLKQTIAVSRKAVRSRYRMIAKDGRPSCAGEICVVSIRLLLEVRMASGGVEVVSRASDSIYGRHYG